MIKLDESQLQVAEYLLQIKAIKLQPNDPFTWASGWNSPIYCDNRVSLSYPKIRTYIRQQLASKITAEFGEPDIIVGVATGGIAQGALVAEELGLPFAYVRSSAKAHGMGNQIEGHYSEGQNAVVIEDLVSTGGSSLKAVEALRESGVNVKGLISIFTYGFDLAINNFKEANCPMVSLTDYDVLVEKALESEYINEDDLESLRNWRKAPDKWNK